MNKRQLRQKIKDQIGIEANELGYYLIGNVAKALNLKPKRVRQMQRMLNTGCYPIGSKQVLFDAEQLYMLISNIDNVPKDPKDIAGQASRNAVKRGVLIRPTTCSNCNEVGKIHGHHPDYKKPLDVVWLCASCHAKEHAQLRHKAKSHERG